MQGLIRSPETPWGAAAQLAVSAGMALAIVAAAATIGGALGMAPALLRDWAYRKIGGAEPG